jgi:hypothetical protein
MTTDRPRRRLASSSALAAAAALLFVGATPQLASADGTRTISGSFTCVSNRIPAEVVFVDTGSGWSVVDWSHLLPGTRTMTFSKVVPADATRLSVDGICYVDISESYGYSHYPAGTWTGYTSSITAGTSTVNGTWLCDRGPVYPGPWVRVCSATSLSYS